MSKSIFEHIENMTAKKVHANEYTEEDWKSFSPYMVAQWFSMDTNLLEIINELQTYLIGVIPPEHVYRVYFGLLAQKKYWLKYIKGKKTSRYRPELIEHLAIYFEQPKRIIEQHYLPIYFSNEQRQEEVEIILREMGITERDIKKFMTIK